MLFHGKICFISSNGNAVSCAKYATSFKADNSFMILFVCLERVPSTFSKNSKLIGQKV